MTIYGITLDYQIIKTWMGSPEMMDCREIQFTLADAESRVEELKRQQEPSHDN